MSKTLLEFLEEDHVQLIQRGSNRLVAHCPFHDGDRSPSFTVYLDTDSYFCWGCTTWGDSLKWLTDYRKLSHIEAVQLLGLDYRPRRKPTVVKIKNTSIAWAYLSSVAQTYHEFLFKQHGAIEYLKGRGLELDTIKKYKLGYTDGRVLEFQWASEFELAQEVGILNDKGNEMLSHRITIPNYANNYCDYVIGRTVVNDKIKYLGTQPPKPIFGIYQNRLSPVLFLAEGQFDWLVLCQWGYPAVAVGGSHLTKDNRQLLKNKKIVIIPDNDDPGIKTSKRLKDQLEGSEILDYASLGAKDIGELVLQDNAQEKFGQVVRKQLSWLNTSISPKALMTYFPTSVGTILSP